MRRSVGAIWPRAESNLYVDLKRLGVDGYAGTEASLVGARPRTTYRITAAGTAALADWVAQAGEPPAFECDALVRLAFATIATPEVALAHVQVIADHAQARVDLGRRLATEYIEGTGPLPQRLHINAVMWRFLWEMHCATARWAQWARGEIEQWPDTADSPAMRERGLAALRDGLSAG